MVVGVDVVDGHSADRCGPLGVEQDEQAGDPVFGLEGVVVQEPAGVFPPGFGVDGLLRAGPFDRGQLEGGQFLGLGPADEVPELASEFGSFTGQPAVELALASGVQGEAAGGEPVEQPQRAA